MNGTHQTSVVIVKKTPNNTYLEIEPDVKHLYDTRRVLNSFLNTIDIPNNIKYNFVLICGEIIQNAIRHGSPIQPDGTRHKIHLKLRYTQHYLYASIKDSGCTYFSIDDIINQEKLRIAKLHDGTSAPCVSTGLLLVQKLATRVTWHFEPTGTRVRIFIQT